MKQKATEIDEVEKKLDGDLVVMQNENAKMRALLSNAQTENMNLINYLTNAQNEILRLRSQPTAPTPFWHTVSTPSLTTST